MNKHNYKPGDKVRFIDAVAHEEYEGFYPPAGTIGTVVEGTDIKGDIYVRWAGGSTALDGTWYCGADQVEPVEEDEA